MAEKHTPPTGAGGTGPAGHGPRPARPSNRGAGAPHRGDRPSSEPGRQDHGGSQPGAARTGASQDGARRPGLSQDATASDTRPEQTSGDAPGQTGPGSAGTAQQAGTSGSQAPHRAHRVADTSTAARNAGGLNRAETATERERRTRTPGTGGSGGGRIGQAARDAAFGAAAVAMSAGYAAADGVRKGAGRAFRAIKRPFSRGGSALSGWAARTLGSSSPLARKAVATTSLTLVMALIVVGGLVGIIGARTNAADSADDAIQDCQVDAAAAADQGTGTFTGKGVPAKAVPWVENAMKYSKLKIPGAFFAFIMKQESDFNPDVFSNDSNGGTWGLFQINAEEWGKITDGGSFSSPDITDPMIHTQYGAQYFDQRLQTVRTMRKNHPNAAYTTQLTELEDLAIAHNAGEGNLEKYPDIPSITQKYLANMRTEFPAFGGGTASGGTGGIGAAPVAATGGIGDAASNDGGSKAGVAQLGDVKSWVSQAASVTWSYFKSGSAPAGSGVTSMGGTRAPDGGDHSKGLAVDYMVANDAQGKATGDALANWAVDNAKSLNIQYVIWQQKIWNVARSSEGWRAMADRGSPTANHMDHVHISYTTTATGNPTTAAAPDGTAPTAPSASATPASGTCPGSQSSAGTQDAGLVAGGLTKEQAQAIVDRYNKEGDAFLDKKYGPDGGPGGCGDNHAENCVSFSTWFVNVYTTFNRYAPGDGKDTASSMASLMGKKTQSTPVPYSIFSMPTSGPGHTGVVFGVEKDGSLIIGQADYCRQMGNIAIYPKSKTTTMTFVDVSDLLKDKSAMSGS